MQTEFRLAASHPVVRDHMVHGQHVLPGLAYIDLIYQFFRAQGYSPFGLELRDVTIYHPLVVADGRSHLCRMVATQAADGVWAVVVTGRERGDNGSDGEVTRHASARMCAATAPAFEDAIDLADVARSARQVIDIEEFYGRCRARGLVHDGFMKAEGVAYMTPAGAVIDIRVGPQALADADRLLFHPALMDAAAVCAVIAATPAADLDRHELALPLVYRAFHASACVSRRCLVRVNSSALQRRGDVRYVDLEFFGETGRKIATLSQLGSKLVREATSFGPASPVQPRPPVDRRRDPLLADSTQPATTAASERDLSAGIERFLRELIAEQARRPVAEVSGDSGYYEMGLDSVALLELVRRIERALDLTLTPTLFFEYTTIGELARYLTAAYPEQCRPLVGRIASARSATVPTTDKPAADGLRVAHRGRASQDIAIIALDGRFPRARDVSQYWDNLRQGKDCLSEVPSDRWPCDPYFNPEKGRAATTCSKWGGFIDGVDEFDPLFFNVSPREAALIDPQQRLFLQTAWNLFETAGYTRRRRRDVYGGSVGVYVGVMYQLYSSLEFNLAHESAAAVSSHGAIANRVSYTLGLNGPSLAVDTLCSSSAVALHLACNDLRHGECQLAIAGGVNLSIHPKKYVGLSQLRLTGTNPERRSFADGDGFQPAEAVCAVLLKPLVRAIEDGDHIHAVIKATAANHGGRSQGFSMPSLPAERQVIERVLQAADVDPRTITWVEAAANGAALVDAVEFEALDQVFRRGTADRGFCAIGSAKSNIGHAEAASGLTQLAKVVLQLQHGQLVPSIKADPPNPHVRFDGSAFVLQRHAGGWQRPRLGAGDEACEYPRRALINSFGAGGSNVSILVEEYVGASTEPGVPPADEPQIVPLSARTADRLRAVVSQLLPYVKRTAAPLADIAYTLQCGREAMHSRLAIVARNREELARGMEMFLGPVEAGADEGEAPPALYTGDGALEADVIRELSSGAERTALLQARVSERDLDNLAAMWAVGVDVQWEVLHADRAPRIVPLPTYPFERQRYWLPTGQPTGAAGGQASELLAAEVAPDAVQSAWKRSSVPPRTELERTIVRVWEDVLGVTGIGIEDSFLDLGGSSLTGGRISTRLRELFGVEVPVSAFVGERPTVEAHAVTLVAELARLQDAGTLEHHLQAVAQV